MNTILAPVDFSDAASNALSFAAELAKRSSARLIMVHIAHHVEEESETLAKLKSLESDLKTSFGSDLHSETQLAHGNLVASLKKIIAVQPPDLIVMGTKGASGLKKLLIGSNTVNVIADIKLPVLVIPEVARFDHFLKKGKNRIVLATDLEELRHEGALDILKEMASYIIGSKLRVLSVRPKTAELTDSKRMEREHLLSFFKADLETERVTIFSDGVISGINFYLSQRNEDTGLVAMIARDSGHLIQKHYTREMASHTHLPLLVLHD